MAFSSKIYPGEKFVDTGHASKWEHGTDDLFPVEFGRGLKLGMKGPDGYGVAAKPFPKELLINPSDYPSIIQEHEERGMRLSEQVLKAGIPHKDQDQTNYCFPAGTLVRMSDGTHKPIEKITVLDKVVSAEGRPQRVLKTVVHDVAEPIYNLKIWGHGHLRCTSEHPILTKRGYVPASELKIGDKIAFPKYASESVKMIVTGDYIYEKNTAPQAKHKYRYRNGAMNSGSSFSAQIPGKTAVTITKYPVPDVIHLTPELGRVFGFYLAEGHTAAWSVHFSFNATEKDTLAAECASLIEKTLGCVPHVRVRKNVCQVTIHGGNWSRLFDALFGRGSSEKHLPSDLASGPKEFLAEVLKGWLDGDRNAKNSAVSVSRHMALNMFDIANVLGLRPAFGTHQNPKIGKDGIQRKHSWMISWADNIIHGTEQDETHLWREVKGVELEDFSGSVFNMEVENDNSYIAEGIGVHNCWGNAPCHTVELNRFMQNQETVILSPASVCAPIKGYRNQGGWGLEALEYSSENGWAPVALWPANAIDRRYDTAECRAARMLYRPTEWFELKTEQECASYMLRLMGGTAKGYAWWEHETTGYEPVWIDGELCWRDRNSWRGFGYNGFFLLRGSRKRFDDCVAPAVVIAS